MILVSIIIRTYNEAQYLPSLLEALQNQKTENCPVEIIIVDSGSTDQTLEIAKHYDTRVVHIKKEYFTFGRSLNLGCRVAKGKYLVFISGHCIPVNEYWLSELIMPLIASKVAYTYGGQVGNKTSKFSECQLFRKYYPVKSKVPQEGFFCNNANAGLIRSMWEKNPFDEELTGLEDMELAKRLVGQGLKIGYVAEASVFHLHNEKWHKVRLRYQREAIALQQIMPQVQVQFTDFLRYFISALLFDLGKALQQKVFMKKFVEIFLFRLMQYWGTYRGNHEHRKLSRKMKEAYFYPK